MIRGHADCRLRAAVLLLGSTALSAGLILAPVAATAAEAPADRSAVRAAKRAAPKPPPRKTASAALASDVANALDWSVRLGKRGLLASVFDSTHRQPAQRDAVLAHARTLAPGLTRDLTTAADLGVLTSGHPLMLSPRGTEALRARTAGAASAPGSAAIASAAAPAPSAYSPWTTPPNMPPAADQTWHLDMIGAGVAHGRGYTGAGVAVAVGDTGFDISHPSLAGKLDLARAYSNLVVQGETYDPRFVDIQWATDVHGTHVAGIIAAKKDAGLSASHGVAHDATIVPIRMIFDSYVYKNNLGRYVVGSPSVDGIDYFTSLANVKVMNASFGPGVDPTSPPLDVWSLSPDTQDEAGAAARALAADKIIVAANGNDRYDHPVAGRNPSGLALHPFIRPEHANSGVYDDHGAGFNYSWLLDQPGQIIGVMSVRRDKAPAWYTNFCGVAASWCVAAPGGDQWDSRFGGVFATVPRGEYDFLQGTSMAAPVVSGAIAVLIDAYPGYSARDLAQVLFSTTEDLGVPGIDAVYGHGLIRLDRATDGPTMLAAGHTETVATDTTKYWSQPLATLGGFTKDGSGVLTIAGRTSAPGDVQVALGTLAVDGTLHVTGNGHALIVNRTGTLAGMGQIVGDTAIAGTLSPGKMANVQDLLASGAIASPSDIAGNSAGQLTFNGNVTLASTATTRIDIDGWYQIPGGAGTHDRIFVSGAGHTFTANGTLTPILRGSVGTPSNYKPEIGSQFVFVEAINGARTAAAFTALEQPSSGLPANGRFDLIYSPTAITLAVTPLSLAGMTNGLPQTSGLQGVASILDNNRAAPGAMPTVGKALYDALYALNTPQAYGTAMTQLSGAGQPAAQSASMGAFSGFAGSIGDRQNALVSGAADSQSGAAQAVAFSYADRTMSAQVQNAEAAFASLTPVTPSQDGWGVWAQGFGRWSSVGDAGALAGSTSRSGGFMLGADRVLADNLIGGIAVGFARTATESAGTTATSDTYTGALYASWTPGRAVVDLRAAAGPSQTQTSRTTILTPSAIQGQASGFGGSIGVEAGYLIPVAQFTMKPYAGLAWQGLRRNGYAETQQPFGLVYPSQSFEKLTTTLGVGFSTQLRVDHGITLMPELKLGWGHDLRDTTLVSQAALLDSAFTVNAAGAGRDAALVGVKLAGWTRENFRLFATYNGEFRSNAVSHQVTGGARVTW